MRLDSRQILPNLVLLAVFWEAVAVPATTGPGEAGLLTMAVLLLVAGHGMRRRARRQLVYRRDPIR